MPKRSSRNGYEKANIEQGGEHQGWRRTPGQVDPESKHPASYQQQMEEWLMKREKSRANFDPNEIIISSDKDDVTTPEAISTDYGWVFRGRRARLHLRGALFKQEKGPVEQAQRPNQDDYGLAAVAFANWQQAQLNMKQQKKRERSDDEFMDKLMDMYKLKLVLKSSR